MGESLTEQCRVEESGPCLSPSVADHPLGPATDHRLGKLLPHQLANQTRAPPRADSRIENKKNAGIDYRFSMTCNRTYA
ncbi:hypothetical protein HN873_047957 [Arachis hypogaea]